MPPASISFTSPFSAHLGLPSRPIRPPPRCESVWSFVVPLPQPGRENMGSFGVKHVIALWTPRAGKCIKLPGFGRFVKKEGTPSSLIKLFVFQSHILSKNLGLQSSFARFVDGWTWARIWPATLNEAALVDLGDLRGLCTLCAVHMVEVCKQHPQPLLSWFMDKPVRQELQGFKSLKNSFEIDIDLSIVKCRLQCIVSNSLLQMQRDGFIELQHGLAFCHTVGQETHEPRWYWV